MVVRESGVQVHSGILWSKFAGEKGIRRILPEYPEVREIIWRCGSYDCSRVGQSALRLPGDFDFAMLDGWNKRYANKVYTLIGFLVVDVFCDLEVSCIVWLMLMVREIACSSNKNLYRGVLYPICASRTGQHLGWQTRPGYPRVVGWIN